MYVEAGIAHTKTLEPLWFEEVDDYALFRELGIKTYEESLKLFRGWKADLRKVIEAQKREADGMDEEDDKDMDEAE